MQQLALPYALCLMAVALFGKRGRLIALSLAWLSVFPAIMIFGMRSAIFAPELVIAIALVPWMLRSRREDLPGAPSWFPTHLTIIIIWTGSVTCLGLMLAGASSEIPVRIPMAMLRMTAPFLAFAIPASSTFSSRELNQVLRVLRLAFIALLAISFVDYLRLLPIEFFFQAREATSELGAAFAKDLARQGYLNRASLGTLCLLGVYVYLMSFQLKQGIQLLNIASIVGLIAVLLLCESRASLLALAAFGVALLMLQKGKRVRNVLIVGIGSVTVYAIMINIPFVAERLNTLTDIDLAIRTSGRLAGYQASINYLLKDPFMLIVGIGYDNWSRHLTPVCRLWNGHNVYLHAIAELGLIGGTFFLGVFIRLGAQFFRCMRLSEEGRLVGGPSLCLLIGLSVSNLFIVGLYPILARLIIVHCSFFIFGLAYARVRGIMGEHYLSTFQQAQSCQRIIADSEPDKSRPFNDSQACCRTQ